MPKLWSRRQAPESRHRTPTAEPLTPYHCRDLAAGHQLRPPKEFADSDPNPDVASAPWIDRGGDESKGQQQERHEDARQNPKGAGFGLLDACAPFLFFKRRLAQGKSSFGF